jgi:glucosamine kinase
MKSDREQLFIGLDAGGTKTSLLAKSPGGSPIATLVGPAANPYRVGFDESAATLAALIDEALARTGRARADGVCAGVAGAGRKEDQQQLAVRLQAKLGAAAPAHLKVVHDADIALEAAFEGRSGVVVIAGTGSVVLARNAEGQVLRAGGWGYLLGDQGSGHAVGLDGLRAVATAMDGGPGTRMRDLIQNHCGTRAAEDLIRLVYTDNWPVQNMAPYVLEAADNGDEVALNILREQAEALVQQIVYVLHRDATVTADIALMGGLMQQPGYQRAFERALQNAVGESAIMRDPDDPVVGAWRLAQNAAVRT